MSELGKSLEKAIREKQRHKISTSPISQTELRAKTDAWYRVVQQQLAGLIVGDLQETASILRLHGVQPNASLVRQRNITEWVAIEGIKGLLGKKQPTHRTIEEPVARAWTLTAETRQETQAGAYKQFGCHEYTAYRKTRGLAIAEDGNVYSYNNAVALASTVDEYDSLSTRGYPTTEWTPTTNVRMPGRIFGEAATTNDIAPMGEIRIGQDYRAENQPYLAMIRQQIQDIATKLA